MRYDFRDNPEKIVKIMNLDTMYMALIAVDFHLKDINRPFYLTCEPLFENLRCSFKDLVQENGLALMKPLNDEN